MGRLLRYALVLIVLFAACSSGGGDDTNSSPSTTTQPAGETIRGHLLLLGGSDGDLTDCEGEGGFSDIGPGTTVTVRDGEGDIVGTSELELRDTEAEIIERLTEDSVAVGTADDEAEVRDLVESGEGGFLCPLFYDVEVKDAEFYELEMGRRDFTISRADLEDQDWRMSSTLNGL